jgi:hypothetical protein
MPQGVTSPRSFLSAILRPGFGTMHLLRVCCVNTFGFVDKLTTKASSVLLEGFTFSVISPRCIKCRGNLSSYDTCDYK